MEKWEKKSQFQFNKNVMTKWNSYEKMKLLNQVNLEI